ncbi:restriction endonuclease subunit S [Pseudoalteromonas carrageenovora]|uniref:restriction endonuclease subunit S n=1 Tax=Pseudoalteromonas carrageenovora TaxID=227 RepID=UPI0026E26883|nr:restriction endonuclease subunit S [Pseudoalteromonas carrageenovora]MDO6547330.1 restriction endonuclease subunit S [Pseudoalteromonas carrageenovora]MDO6831778.1 restriction endonuclease subunit S [Pseudoalteromonas carrageenovora]
MFNKEVIETKRFNNELETPFLKTVPNNWKTKRIKYLLDEVNIRSKTGTEELLSLSKYRGVVKKDSLEEKSGGAESLIGYKLVNEGQLVINKMQAVNGLLAVSKLRGITSPDYSVYKVKGEEEVDIDFLTYILAQPEYLTEFKRRVTGVMEGFIRLYTDDLFDIKVAFPSVDYQRKIVRFLERKTSQIDDAINLKQKQIELLKERKEIIIQNALINGLDSSVSRKNSDIEWLGELPSHWKLRKVKHLFQLVMEPAEKNNEHELLSIYAAIGVRPRKDLAEKGNKASTTDGYWLVEKGDVIVNKLLAWMGAIGLSEYQGVTSPAYDILRPSVDMEPLFYHYLFRMKQCSVELKKHSRGIMDVRLRLYFDKFGSLYVPYPPIDEQKKIIKFIQRHVSKLDKSEQIFQSQIDQFKEYRASLINSALSGKIKIQELT